VFATLGGQLLELGPDLAVVRQRSFPSRFFAGPTRAGARLYLSGHEGTIWSYDWMGDAIDWRRVEALRPYGGIRVEDNVVAQAGGPRNLTREAFDASA
jgi:hypothetical protein